ncbi:MAG TPA: glycosyltransferase family A protein [Pyrinomonadaceae bacterium]|nr:glycosyltransferase family A protein [Pyrinomonadaceae bacterium]
MKSRPLVSVIIPTYNYGRFICEAVDSVLNSDLPADEVEIIVVDDGSTDDTALKVRPYGDRVKYLWQRNLGKAHAISVGIAQARGRYLFNLDADDLFLPEKLRAVVNAFDSDPNIVHVAHPAFYWNVRTDARIVEPIPTSLRGRKLEGKKLLSRFSREMILFGGGSTFAGRAGVLKGIRIPAEVDMLIDEYLVMATLNRGDSFFIDRPLSVWRIHAGNFSGFDTAGGESRLSEKTERGLKNMEAVLSSVQEEDFDEDIKCLYSLKTKVSRLAAKERASQKSATDVVELWLFFIKISRVLGSDLFRVLKTYTILNRTLPTPMLRLLQRAKGTLAEKVKPTALL